MTSLISWYTGITDMLVDSCDFPGMGLFRVKGSEINKSLGFAPRFRSDLVDPIEQNRRRSLSCVEDFAIENRPREAKRMGYLFLDPKNT
jgi:hypothetical protein